MSEIEMPPGEHSAIHSARAPSALGRNPFDEPVGPDPFVERLDELESRLPGALVSTQRSAGPEPGGSESEPISVPISVPQTPRRRDFETAREAHSPDPARPRRDPPVRRKREKIARLTRRRWASTPLVSEIDPIDPSGFFDRLISGEERKRLAALTHLVQGEDRLESPEQRLYDRFGFSPDVITNSFPLFHALYKFYFRVRSEGHANVPTVGPVVLAGNHGGLLPFDAAMAIIDLILHTDPPRLARSIVDRWAGELPWINIFYARCGQVIGTRENFADLLGDGQVVMVFPEGIDGIRKTIAQRHRLQPFRVGFVEHALRARATIVPMAVIGSDNQTPILYDIKPLARILGLPVAPITPTFPLLGPLGLLPYPVKYKIVYGEPLRYHERFGPEGADDSRLVQYLAKQVRRSVQLLIDKNR